jgi:hypothetical protein
MKGGIDEIKEDGEGKGAKESKEAPSKDAKATATPSKEAKPKETESKPKDKEAR